MAASWRAVLGGNRELFGQACGGVSRRCWGAARGQMAGIGVRPLTAKGEVECGGGGRGRGGAEGAGR
jgi:hypothetical protein